MYLSRTALSISTGNEQREAFTGVRLHEVMYLYVFIQASMASWVIVHSRTRLQVLRAGVSTGGGLDERMPKSAIC